MSIHVLESQENIEIAKESIEQKIRTGGERNRLHLAMTLHKEANVLLLDEPTNDLDVNTLRSLEEGLENFAESEWVLAASILLKKLFFRRRTRYTRK